MVVVVGMYFKYLGALVAFLSALPFLPALPPLAGFFEAGVGAGLVGFGAAGATGAAAWG